MGTPDYVAPEQAADRSAVGPPCDVYSLGCTLHFLLVGRPVFSGDTAEAKLLAHRHEPAPSIRAARPDAPESLDRLFQRMLAKRPEDRPATMAEVMTELEGCLEAVRAVGGVPGGDARIPEASDGRDRRDGTAQPSAAHALSSSERPESIAGQAQRGLLVIHVREPDLAIQVADPSGDIVMDCPAAEGTLQVAIPPGRYRLVVRKCGQECLAEMFEIGASGREAIEIPKG
jgi:hypothetical protein